MIEFLLFIGMTILGAFCVIGLIEWVKSVHDAVVDARSGKGKVSTIAWPVLSLLFSVGVGFALGKMPNSEIFGAGYNAILFASVLMLSFNEILGYNVIVKLVYHFVDKAVYGEGKNGLIIGEQIKPLITDFVASIENVTADGAVINSVATEG